jgi:SAM-dependent methyltransferase
VIFLLQDLTRWQEQLARSIARNNLSFRSSQIAETVNRILFVSLLLAIAEDRGLLPAGTISSLHNHRLPAQFLSGIASYADALYSGETWDTIPLPESGGVPVLDEQVIRGFLDELAARAERYDFRAMSIPVIAQVLMRYLARTIRRSAVHHAVVTDMHNTALAGETTIPPLILIRSMAHQALDAARKNRSVREILPLRVLDPACGSGTALLSAYRYLLGTAGEPCLTFEERQEILLHSLYGVDINRHAVAVTRMLLVFELYDGLPFGQRPGDFPAMIHSVFRDLRHTILWGNALIGPEIANDESWNFCPPRDRHSLNPFPWDEQFPEIRLTGGFDAVIGNPPEGALEKREWIQQYFQRHYTTYHPAADRSAYFVEKGLALLRTGGTLAFVLRSRWLRGASGSPLRALIRTRQIEEILDFPDEGLCSIRIRNTKPAVPFVVVRAKCSGTWEETWGIAEQERFPVNQTTLGNGGWSLCDTRAGEILAKMERCGTPFWNFCMGEIGCGAADCLDDRLFLDAVQRERLVKQDRRSGVLIRPFIEGRRIARYHAGSRGGYLLCVPAGRMGGALHRRASGREFQKRYPAVARYLRKLVPSSCSESGDETPWYETACRQLFRTKDVAKILFPCRSILPVFTYDDGRSVIDHEAGYIATSSLYLLAVLNSRLARFWFMHRQRPDSSPSLMVTADAVAGFFVHTPDFDNPLEAARHARIEKLVRKMLGYHERLVHEKDETSRERFLKKIDRTDRQIDALVYELYGLTLEEIALIEGSGSA